MREIVDAIQHQITPPVLDVIGRDKCAANRLKPFLQFVVIHVIGSYCNEPLTTDPFARMHCCPYDNPSLHRIRNAIQSASQCGRVRSVFGSPREALVRQRTQFLEQYQRLGFGDRDGLERLENLTDPMVPITQRIPNRQRAFRDLNLTEIV